MTNQTNVERYKLEIVNNHGDRYIRCEPAPDGSWVMFRDVAALQKRCEEAERTAIQAAECHARETRRADALQKRVAKLEEALATARREGMEEAARIAENEPELSGPMPAEFEKYSRETLARASCIATKREIAATIRAALEGGKKDG